MELRVLPLEGKPASRRRAGRVAARSLGHALEAVGPYLAPARRLVLSGFAPTDSEVKAVVPGALGLRFESELRPRRSPEIAVRMAGRLVRFPRAWLGAHLVACTRRPLSGSPGSGSGGDAASAWPELDQMQSRGRLHERELIALVASITVVIECDLAASARAPAAVVVATRFADDSVTLGAVDHWLDRCTASGRFVPAPVRAVCPRLTWRPSRQIAKGGLWRTIPGLVPSNHRRRSQGRD